MSIINGRRHDLQHYEYKMVSDEVRADFLVAAETIIPHFYGNISFTLIGFECFCQIFDQQIHRTPEHAMDNRKVVERFCALVYQGRVFSKTSRGCMLAARYFLKCAVTLDYVAQSPLVFSPNAVDPYLRQILDEVDGLPIDNNLLEYWSGWPSVSSSGSRRYFPLQCVFESCGRDFTRKLYHTMDEFFRTRQRGLHGTWQEFIEAIADLGEQGGVENLKQPQFSKEFFKSLLLQFLKTAKNSVAPINYATAAIEWRNHFQTYVLEYLVPSGLVARPTGGFPVPRGERIAGAKTHVRTGRDGQEVKHKLLTEVPLQVTDRHAVEILFDAIKQDIGWVRKWAEHVTESTWGNAARRGQLAKNGTVIPLSRKGRLVDGNKDQSKAWQRSHMNPRQLNDMAATFEAHGYLTQRDTWVELLYEDRSTAARELGMPSTKAILAFCALLIIEHPALTRSALFSLELCDKNGSLVGVEEIGGHTYLTSFKRRAGPTNAQKSIKLNDRSEELVRRIIMVTQPLRDYLRKKGDDNWRRLFLISGRSFAYPRPIKRDEISYRVELRRDFRLDMAALGAPEAVTKHLVENFTLTRLRASAGVEEYLRTTSVSAMANALGHKEYKKALIDHYLPEPIRRFFEERWVRVFQLGIICEAMKESDYLVEATGFTNIDEVDEFLRNHAITFPDAQSKPELPVSAQSSLVVALDEVCLKLFYALSMVSKSEAERLGGTLFFWHQFAKKLIDYIRSPEFPHPNIRKMFEDICPTVTPQVLRRLLS